MRRALIAGVAGVALIVMGAASTLAMASRSRAALAALSPWSGVAAGRLLDAQVIAARDPRQLQALRPQLIEVLRREPLDFRAARSLAFVMLTRNKHGEARKLMRTVARNTLREPLTHIWLIGDAFEGKRYGEFLHEAEIVMRGKPEAAQPVYGMLTKFIDDGTLIDPIARKLASNPFWRGGFFDAFGSQSKNSANAYRFFQRVGELGLPATASEQRVWLLTQVGRMDTVDVVARWRALQATPLPADEHLLRNGDLEGTTAPQPFDWTFFIPEGSFAEISSSPSGQGKAIYVEMKANGDMTVARQILDLRPGRYRLQYSVYPILALERPDLLVGIDCASGKTFVPLTSSVASGEVDRWSKQTIEFAIPPACRAQQITIGLRPDGLTSDVQAYFDDMSITPVR